MQPTAYIQDHDEFKHEFLLSSYCLVRRSLQQSIQDGWLMTLQQPAHFMGSLKWELLCHSCSPPPWGTEDSAPQGSSQGPCCRAATTVDMGRGEEPQRVLWLDCHPQQNWPLPTAHSLLAGTSFCPHTITREQRVQCLVHLEGEDNQVHCRQR